jgi:hypothetical protein
MPGRARSLVAVILLVAWRLSWGAEPLKEALISSYVGHEGAETQIAELLLAPDRPAVTRARSASHSEIPVFFARERCLYDHLGSLQELLAELGYGDASIDVLAEGRR